MSESRQHDKQIRALETRLLALNDKVASFSTMAQVGDLIPIVRRPGWTTVAELQLVAGLVESMHSQIDALSATQRVLNEGCRAVGSAE